MLTSDDLHRLRQLRDDLEWLQEKAESEKRSPYNHYTQTIRSTRGVVRSMIGNVTGWQPDFWQDQQVMV